MDRLLLYAKDASNKEAKRSVLWRCHQGKAERNGDKLVSRMMSRICDTCFAQIENKIYCCSRIVTYVYFMCPFSLSPSQIGCWLGLWDFTKAVRIDTERAVTVPPSSKCWWEQVYWSHISNWLPLHRSVGWLTKVVTAKWFKQIVKLFSCIRCVCSPWRFIEMLLANNDKQRKPFLWNISSNQSSTKTYSEI